MRAKKLKIPKELEKKWDAETKEGNLIELNDLFYERELSLWDRRPQWIPNWFRIKMFFRGIRNYFLNCYRYRTFLKNDYEFDYASFYEVIYLKCHFLQNNFEECSFDVDVDKKVKQLKITKNLAKRLYEDNYFYLAEKDFKHSIYMEQQDREMLFDLMKENINNWWN